MLSKFAEDEPSASHFQYEYKRQLGAHKPKFEAVPDSYYPLTWCQVFKYSIFVLFLILLGCGCLVGCIYWGTRNTSQFVLIWVVIFMSTFAFIMVMFYVFGKDRIRQEKEIIEEHQRYQEQMRKNKKIQV